MAKRTRWRFSALVREAVVNATATGTRAIVMSALSVAVGVLIAALQLYDWSSLTQQVRSADAQGRSVVTISASPQMSAQIEVASCEALTSLEGVEAAGVIVLGGRSSFDQLGVGLATARASSTLIPEVAAADLAIGSALGTAESGTLTSGSGYVRSYTTASAQPAGVDVNSLVLSPLLGSDTTAPTCIVRLRSFAHVHDYLPMLLASLQSTGPPLVTRASTEAVDPVASYSTRITVWAPALGGLGCALLGLATLFARGSEIATYRMSGTTIRATLGICTFEQALYAAILWCSASLTTVVWHGSLGHPVGTIAAAGVAAFTWLAVYPIGATPFLRRDPTVLAKDR